MLEANRRGNRFRSKKDSIKTEFQEAWSAATRYLRLKVPPDHLSGAEVDRLQSQAARHGNERFEPWLTVLETAITHLSSLFLSMVRTSGRKRSRTERWRTPAVLVGNACAHASAIRRLVLSGFDSSARVLHRTMLDTLAAFLFSLSDEAFRTEFGQARDIASAKSFWLRNLRYDKVHRRLTELEKTVGFSEGLSSVLLAHRQEALGRYSGYVHGLFTPAAFTAMVPSAFHPGEVRPGVVGHPSLTSIWTLDETVKSLGYFSSMGLQLLRKPPAESGLPQYPFNKKQQFDRATLVACHTFLHLLSVHWEDASEFALPWDPPKTRPHRRRGR